MRHISRYRSITGFLLAVILALVTSSCSSSNSASSDANEKVCNDIAVFMEGSGYMEGTRESLMNAVNKIIAYRPDAVSDWVNYVSPSEGDYVPSLNDNDNAVYQSLYRLQSQAIDYSNTRNSGAYYNEWKYFLQFCGIEE